MGLGFTTSGRLDEHNRDDNTRSREHGPAATPKPHFYAMTLSPWHFHPHSFRAPLLNRFSLLQQFKESRQGV